MKTSLTYDIQKYITKIKMSSKKRILVEGKDDKSHLQNLLNIIEVPNIKIDTAEQIKGNCKITSKNNRAKIDKIFNVCKEKSECLNLYYLCDREFYKFSVENIITDDLKITDFTHNLNWTIGHSIENYFLDFIILSDAYRYLCGSEYKSKAIELFKKILPSSFRLVASITLSAKDLGQFSYPNGVVMWDKFSIDGDVLSLNIAINNNTPEILKKFVNLTNEYNEITNKTDIRVCANICRGHTVMLLLQRIFSYCLYTVILSDDEVLAKKESLSFSKIKESQLSSALGESWVRHVKQGYENYPKELIHSIAS
ncbi:hypothetical protein [Vibrio sp. 2-2(8)]|uniref:hypothetical protein n=1 Tax=Vibrio sp. 2-2(8) TaxID=2591014 RepID=UPI00148364EA|nr:hypothetical protein [Vibrio sp. 2-2(8)]NNN48682.1 hypothetical protein [Vibrio sp. 2-2(8)]